MLTNFQEFTLLAVKQLTPDAYGVNIHRRLENVLLKDVSKGAVNTTLNRLKEKGYLEKTKGVPTAKRGGRAKLYYTLTDLGQKAINEKHAALLILRNVKKDGDK